MKTGILTLPLHTNYGGILQAYALQTVLERMGNEVSVITRDRKEPISWKTYLNVPRRFARLLAGTTTDPFYEWHKNAATEKIQQYTKPFIKRYIHEDSRPLEQLPHNAYECIVVGSDQIWRPKYIESTLRSTVENAFLGFADGWALKRVAYAASFGTDENEFSPDDVALVRPLLQKFIAVSTREDSGVRICENVFQVHAEHVLDPTLLLQKSDYLELIENYPSGDTGTLMSYVLDRDEDKDRAVRTVLKKKQLKGFMVGAKVDDWSAPIEERIQPPLEQWLRGFDDAEFIVTDSFHACVFSVLFMKPFLVYGNAKRGLSRIQSFLAMLGLQSRLILGNDDITDSLLDDEICWDEVNDRLNHYRRESLGFLERALAQDSSHVLTSDL